ncbi:transglutaminase-like protein, partial [Haematococcus lacustris]
MLTNAVKPCASSTPTCHRCSAANGGKHGGPASMLGQSSPPQVLPHVLSHALPAAFPAALLPQADKGRVSAEVLTQHTDLALAARHSSPWALSVPWALFLNNVLPYASLDEPRDEWRQLFVDRLAPLGGRVTVWERGAAGAAVGRAGGRVGERGSWCCCREGGGIRFKADQTPDIMSPAQVIAAGYASCTGLSIFLVAACRAVGIPARVAAARLKQPQPGSREQGFNRRAVVGAGLWSHEVMVSVCPGWVVKFTACTLDSPPLLPPHAARPGLHRHP